MYHRCHLFYIYIYLGELMHTANFLMFLRPPHTTLPLGDSALCANCFFLLSSKWFQQSEQVWTLQEIHPTTWASGTSAPPFSLLGLLLPRSVSFSFFNNLVLILFSLQKLPTILHSSCMQCFDLCTKCDFYKKCENIFGFISTVHSSQSC